MKHNPSTSASYVACTLILNMLLHDQSHRLQWLLVLHELISDIYYIKIDIFCHLMDRASLLIESEKQDLFNDWSVIFRGQ